MSKGINEIEVDIHEICCLGRHSDLEEILNSTDFYTDILLERDEEGFIPYHLSLIYCRHKCVDLMLNLSIDFQVPYQGFMPIHLAMACAGFPDCHEDLTQTVNCLLKHKQDVTSRDRLGRTALHIACAYGLADLIPILVQAGVKPELKDFSGKMPIHYAIENYQAECFKQLLQEMGSDMFFCTDNRGDKPIHTSVRTGSWECFNILITFGSEEMLNENNEFEETPEEVARNCGLYNEFVRARQGDVFPSSAYKGTLLITDETCKLHASIHESLKTPQTIYKQIKIQPENPRRLEILVDLPYGALLTSDLSFATWKKATNPAHISDILRVHEYSYILNLKKAINKIPELSFPQKFDIDTLITKESYNAALLAANCVIEAIDEVVQGKYKNAFCVIRPPGHHVGPFGAVTAEEDPNSKSTGFCLFNNIAIGAGYAKYTYSKVIKKVAIVDFDVHHGNGTEAMVRNLVPNQVTHEINSAPFFGNLVYDSYKPWLDDDDNKNVLFISSHAYGSDAYGRFYPASGKYCSSEDLHPAGILNVPLSKCTDSSAFRQRKIYIEYREKVFPRLIEFAPDLLLISAGFDAHGLDSINHGFVDLDEDDFRWVTEELIKIANTSCKGKIVSVLEGGYSVRGNVVAALGLSVASHVRALMRATQEHFCGSEGNDNEKMMLKSSVNESFRALKRSRKMYIENLEVSMENQEMGEGVEEFNGEKVQEVVSEESRDDDDDDEDEEDDEDSVEGSEEGEEGEDNEEGSEEEDIQESKKMDKVNNGEPEDN